MRAPDGRPVDIHAEVAAWLADHPGVIDDDAAHAPLGPSSAEGWSTCSDYVNANRGLPDDQSEAAAEGTAAHAIADDCLTLGLDAHEFIGSKLRVAEWTFEWTDDDADLLQHGIDEIRQLGGQFYGEHRVDISKWTIPGQFGTLDRGVILPDLIVIDDLKWGRGVPVSAFENKQLVLYALGFWDKIGRHVSDTQNFRLSIDQPRCPGGGGVWETNLETLLNMGEWLKGRADLTTQPNPSRTASEKGCMWCRRKVAPGGCDTYEDFMVAFFGAQFEDLDEAEMLGEPIPLESRLTTDRRAYIVRHRSMIERWLEQMADDALADALMGMPCGGLKAVEGRKSPDKWTDKEAAGDVLTLMIGPQKAFTQKLITPTQAGKLITADNKAKLADLIIVGTKKPILVPAGDARPAIMLAEFDDLPEEGTEK